MKKQCPNCTTCNRPKSRCTCKTPASPELFDLVEDPCTWINKAVHVDGWTGGCWFILKAYDKATCKATLETPKTHRMYTTSNRLLKTRSKSRR